MAVYGCTCYNILKNIIKELVDLQIICIAASSLLSSSE